MKGLVGHFADRFGGCDARTERGGVVEVELMSASPPWSWPNSPGMNSWPGASELERGRPIGAWPSGFGGGEAVRYELQRRRPAGGLSGGPRIACAEPRAPSLRWPCARAKRRARPRRWLGRCPSTRRWRGSWLEDRIRATRDHRGDPSSGVRAYPHKIASRRPESLMRGSRAGGMSGCIGRAGIIRRWTLNQRVQIASGAD